MFASLTKGIDDEVEEDDEDNEHQANLVDIAEEPIETTESSDTPQLETKDRDPPSHEEDDTKEEENQDTLYLGKEPQSREEGEVSPLITEECSESNSEKFTLKPEENLTNDGAEAGMDVFTIVEVTISSSRVK